MLLRIVETKKNINEVIKAFFERRNLDIFSPKNQTNF